MCCLNSWRTQKISKSNIPSTKKICQNNKKFSILHVKIIMKSSASATHLVTLVTILVLGLGSPFPLPFWVTPSFEALLQQLQSLFYSLMMTHALWHNSKVQQALHSAWCHPESILQEQFQLVSIFEVTIYGKKLTKSNLIYLSRVVLTRYIVY